LPPQGKTEAVLGKAKDLISASIMLNFPLDFEWNLDSLSQHVSSWLGNPAKSPTSKVGILCSTGFQRLIQAQVGSDLSHAFQQMLLACTTAYNQEKGAETSQFSDEELQQISSVAGEYVLASLERRLTPAELEKNMATLEYSQALFLVLLGTILAVSYMEPIHDPPTSDNALVSTYLTCGKDLSLIIQQHVDSTLSQPLYESVQEHLCATLAHYMIYLSQKTRTTFDPPTQEHLITKAHERWQAQGHFQWKTSVQFQETYRDADSKFASTSNSGEERATSLTDHNLEKDALEEFEHQEGCELFNIRACSSSSTFPIDAESIIDDHRITPPVWTQDAFARSAGIGIIYDPTIAVLPDRTVGSFATTNVFDFLEDTTGPRSQLAQFPTSDITTNSSLDIMVDSSTGLSSTSIRQCAVEETENTVAKLNTPLYEVPYWSTIPVGSPIAWKETVNTEKIQAMRNRTLFSPEKHKRAYLMRRINACIVCKSMRVRCNLSSRVCGQCNKTNEGPFKNFNANNNLLRSYLKSTMIELEKRRRHANPGTLFATNELRSDSSVRLTVGNTTSDCGWTWLGGYARNSQQHLATELFTKEDVWATSTNVPQYKQHPYTNGLSQHPIMPINEECSDCSVQELNALDVTAFSDSHDNESNSTRHLKASVDALQTANKNSISWRFLV